MNFHASILRLVDDPERVECLRKMLSSFNHQCRNSLNGIKMSLYLFKREAGGPMPSAGSNLSGHIKSSSGFSIGSR